MITSGPIIVMGMHRSGTSIVTRILNKFGLFAGKNLEKNFEARFFLSLNNWLLKQGGASWDRPHDFDQLISAPDYRELLVFFLGRFITLPRVASYMGVLRYLLYRSPERIRCPWGWKDPRNTITLPLWLEVFPRAKVINVERNGLDVALSLIKRRADDFDKLKRNKNLRSYYYSIFLKRSPIGGSLRLGDLKSSVQLWKYYLEKGRSYANNLGDRFLTVRYEDLIADSENEIRRMLAFCNMKTPQVALSAGIQLDPSRAYAYKGVLDLDQLDEATNEDLMCY